MDRIWDMPNSDTMLVPSIRSFTLEYLAKSRVSVDPFARNCRLATYTNDLNPDTAAEYHMEAGEFLSMLVARGVVADLLIFDPPYSPRQVKECYDGIGRKMNQTDAMTARMRGEWRAAAAPVMGPGAVVLSFGWNTVGFGINAGYAIERIQLVCHGSDHNDTICMAERKLPVDPELFGAEIAGV